MGTFANMLIYWSIKSIFNRGIFWNDFSHAAQFNPCTPNGLEDFATGMKMFWILSIKELLGKRYKFIFSHLLIYLCTLCNRSSCVSVLSDLWNYLSRSGNVLKILIKYAKHVCWGMVFLYFLKLSGSLSYYYMFPHKPNHKVKADIW